MTESQLVHIIDQALEAAGHLSFPQNSNVTGHRKNTRYKRGTPDIIVCLSNGKFLGIEVKMDSGRLEESQKAMREKFKWAGKENSYLVVRESDWRMVLALWLDEC